MGDPDGLKKINKIVRIVATHGQITRKAKLKYFKRDSEKKKLK